MPEPTTDATDVVTSFKALPRERQAALLQRMSPDQKRKLNSALDAHLASPSATATPPAAAPAPGYGSEILGGIKRSLSGIAAMPGQLMSAHDTFGVSKETEEKVPGLLRIPGNLIGDTLQAFANGKTARDNAANAGEGTAGQILATAEQYPILGEITRYAEGGGPGTQVGPINVNMSPKNIGAAAEGITTMEAPKAISEAGVGTLNKVGKLRETARAVAQGKLGASAFDTTERTVSKYNADSEAAKVAQAESDAKVAKTNQEAAAAAAGKTQKAQAQMVGKNEAAMNKADIDTEQQAASTAEANRKAQTAHQEATRKVQEHNATQQQAQARADALDASLKQDSHKIGIDTTDLDAKLRTEGNEKYAAVKAKVAQDSGVPLSDLAASAREAEGMLKGSTENIKQFRELIRKAPEESGVQTSVGELKPGDQLYEMLKSQGAIDTGGNLPFDELQGYSSEIGRKLARGGLDSDIFHALKFLKEKIDAAKSEIAKRNDAGPELKEADTFWNKYLESFHDKDSATAKVRNNVGKLDPEFYAEPFTKGKSTGVATDRLRDMPTRHSAEANALAQSAEKVRADFAERGGIKPKPLKDLPKPPPVHATAPRAMAELQPIPGQIQPEVTPNKVVPGPKTPTVAEITADKALNARSSAYALGRMNKFDVGTAAASAAAAYTGHLWTAAAVPAIRFGVPSLLKAEGFIRFISQPGEADVAAAAKLPEPARTELVGNLRKVIDAQKAAGKPMQVSPAVQRLVQSGGAASTAVSNRREAREAVGRPTP